ncbi:hypothetical protein AHAS_Ahas16G0174900 [Arachis hypogaea]
MLKLLTCYTVLSSLRITERCLDTSRQKKSGRNCRSHAKVPNNSKKQGLICYEKSTRCLP